jgi:hypothetical protein
MHTFLNELFKFAPLMIVGISLGTIYIVLASSENREAREKEKRIVLPPFYSK